MFILAHSIIIISQQTVNALHTCKLLMHCTPINPFAGSHILLRSMTLSDSFILHSVSD